MRLRMNKDKGCVSVFVRIYMQVFATQIAHILIGLNNHVLRETKSEQTC